MMEEELLRTRLEQLLRQRHLTLEEFRKQYQRAAGGTVLSERQAYRWVAGEVRSLPYPQAQATLEKMFGEPAAQLFGPPYGTGALRLTRRHNGMVTARGTTRTDWEGPVIAMSADRARDFLTRIEASNVGAETLDQLMTTSAAWSPPTTSSRCPPYSVTWWTPRTVPSSCWRDASGCECVAGQRRGPSLGRAEPAGRRTPRWFGRPRRGTGYSSTS